MSLSLIVAMLALKLWNHIPIYDLCWLGFQHSEGHMASFQIGAGKGRPQVSFRALLQAKTGTWVEPPIWTI
jgi:hypothetical protein